MKRRAKDTMPEEVIFTPPLLWVAAAEIRKQMAATPIGKIRLARPLIDSTALENQWAAADMLIEAGAVIDSDLHGWTIMWKAAVKS